MKPLFVAIQRIDKVDQPIANLVYNIWTTRRCEAAGRCKAGARPDAVRAGRRTRATDREALALRWVDVDLAEATLTISATLSNQGERVEPKTASSVRRLALPALTLGLLRDLRAGHQSEETDFVFCTDSGRPLNRHNVRRDRAGIEQVRFHALRATSLSLRLAGGAAYEDVARVAGHASTRMLLEVYGRPMQGDRRMADLMDAVWQNGPEMAPKWLSGRVHAERPKAKNPRRSADSDVVEVRRLELLTPYMRSKCSTN